MRTLSVMMFALCVAAQEEEAAMLQVLGNPHNKYTKEAEYHIAKEAKYHKLAGSYGGRKRSHKKQARKKYRKASYKPRSTRSQRPRNKKPAYAGRKAPTRHRKRSYKKSAPKKFKREKYSKGKLERYWEHRMTYTADNPGPEGNYNRYAVPSQYQGPMPHMQREYRTNYAEDNPGNVSLSALIRHIDTNKNSCLSLREVLSAGYGGLSDEELEVLTQGALPANQTTAIRHLLGNDGYQQLIKFLFQLVDAESSDCLPPSEFAALDDKGIGAVVRHVVAPALSGDGCFSLDDFWFALVKVGLDEVRSEAALMLLTRGTFSVVDLDRVGALLGPASRDISFPVIDEDMNDCVSLTEIAEIDYDAILGFFATSSRDYRYRR